MERGVDFLGVLADDDRRHLQQIGTTVSYAKGKAVLSQGQVADKVVILRRGRVKVVFADSDGHETVLGFRGPGALIGEQALVDGRPRSAGVVTVEPTEGLVVAASAFRGFLSHRPDVALRMLSLLSERLRDSDHRLAQFAAADTTGRVAARLVELCEDHGEPTEDEHVKITLPLTQEDLANWAGASLEATARALRQLRELGWIATGRRAIVVRDLDAMRERAA